MPNNIGLWGVRTRPKIKVPKYQNYNISNFSTNDSHISKNNIVPGCPHSFLVFVEAFWDNKMNKYGILWVQKSRNH